MSSLRRRHLSLFVLFFVPGLGLASWITRTPALRDLLGLSLGEMGLLLLALSIGSTTGLVASSPALAHWGTKPLLVFGVVGMLIGIPLLGVGAHFGAFALAALGLGLFGLGMGSTDIAMNVEGAAVEQAIGKPAIPALHGTSAAGSVAGALVGILATLLNVPVVLHLTVIAVASAPALIWALRGIPYTAPEGKAVDQRTGRRSAPVWKDSRLILIGVIVLALALAEGSANDWLPLLMVDEHGLEETISSLIYLIFVLSVAAGRFSGSWFITRFGNARVLAGSAAIGAIGLILIVLANNLIVAGVAVILWGIGASLGFPIAISAAGSSGQNAAARVALVSILGYVAFLAGPPFLGFIGEQWGLRGAMVVVLIGVILAVILSPTLAQRRHTTSASPDNKKMEQPTRT